MDDTDRKNAAIETVAEWLRDKERPESIVNALRDAIDYVLDGSRTGRYDIKQLDSNEKTFIGTKVEHAILSSLGLEHFRTKGKPDTVIEGVPVDIKFSLNAKWMIPREAVGQLCLLTSADDAKSSCSVGLFLAEEHLLNTGGNQDRKRSIATESKKFIRWLIFNGTLPENFLLHLNPQDMDAVFTLKSGQRRVTEFFRRVQNRPISRKVLSTIARQADPRARARDARKKLETEGIFVYTSRKNPDAKSYGLPPVPTGFWMSGPKKIEYKE